ncbi:tyrosine-type recombinase/integrase [Psychrobacillus sp. BM2]|uniref:tyrosine-type recombinase/integrase n=1 Tax=Psychrobacillus sp. BM2 TaxID=3400421 RepID=UPI003B01056C
MASYKELKPAKDGKPRIKITVEQGYDEVTGKRLREFKTATLNSLSERAIKKAITEFEIEVAAMENNKSLENITFEQFAKRWMDIYVRPDLSIGTRDTYENYLNKGVIESLGQLKMSKIKTINLVMFFNEQKENKGGSLEGKYMMMKGIFSKAVKWGVIEENPMKNVDRPKGEKKNKETEFYDEEQLKQLLVILEDVYPKHRIGVKLAAFVGLRLSEIAGIRLECLNFKDNTILIDKILKYDKETKSFKLGPTKSKKSRIVNVPKVFMKEIEQYAREQKKQKMKLGAAWNPLKDEDGNPINLLITKSNGYPSHTDGLSARWVEIVSKHKLPVLNFHGLRHSYASYMVSKGVNFKIIQEQLGHTDIKQTLNTYSHLSDKDKSKASDLLNAIL